MLCHSQFLTCRLENPFICNTPYLPVKVGVVPLDLFVWHKGLSIGAGKLLSLWQDTVCCQDREVLKFAYRLFAIWVDRLVTLSAFKVRVGKWIMLTYCMIECLISVTECFNHLIVFIIEEMCLCRVGWDTLSIDFCQMLKAKIGVYLRHRGSKLEVVLL